MSKKSPYPDTSREAFHSLDPVNLAVVHGKILDALKIIGSGTFEDIARQAKLEPQRVWRRLAELEKHNLVHRPGEKKVLSSGRNGLVWHLRDPSQPTPTPVVENVPIPGKTVSDFSKVILQQQKMF